MTYYEAIIALLRSKGYSSPAAFCKQNFVPYYYFESFKATDILPPPLRKAIGLALKMYRGQFNQLRGKLRRLDSIRTLRAQRDYAGGLSVAENAFLQALVEIELEEKYGKTSAYQEPVTIRKGRRKRK